MCPGRRTALVAMRPAGKPDPAGYIIMVQNLNMDAMEAESSLEYDGSPMSVSSSMGDAWVTQFCEKPRNQYFCEVAEEFMEDEFNLTGLSQLVPRYKEALELILDLEHESPVALPDIPAINSSGELLYGLIHARYIITRPGLQAMAQKYECHEFGTCPRVLCEDTALLPMGRHDLPGYETVRLFCPCCRDLYLPPSQKFVSIDGAFFGSSFPGMFLEANRDIELRVAHVRKQQFQLRIYGFKVSVLSRAGPRMKWLRETPESEDFQQAAGEPEEDPDVLE